MRIVSWLRRLGAFARAVFPFFPNQIVTVSMCAVTYFALSTMVAERAFDAAHCVIGALSVLLMGFALRVSDELKDRESDRVHFPDRPLVRGVVSVGDLYAALAVVAAVTLALNLFFTTALVATTWISAMLFACLMFKWFFLEARLRKSLPLAFLTHHPIVFLLQFYLLSFFGGEAFAPRPVALVCGVGLLATAWEISRKVRSRPQETSYQTYSQVFGLQGSVYILCGVVAFAFGLSAWAIVASEPLTWSRFLWVLPSLGAVAVFAEGARFIARPDAPPLLLARSEHFAVLLIATLAASSFDLGLR